MGPLPGKYRSKPPTIKQRKLMRGVIAGKTITQAAKDAGYPARSAHVAGSQELKKLRAAMPAELDRAGLGLGQMAREIKRGIDKGDIGKHDAYLKLALQCHGALESEGQGGQAIGIGVFILKGLKERGLMHLLPSADKSET